MLHNADSYAQQLRDQGAVIASFAERRADIVQQLKQAADEVGGGVVAIEDEALLDEVTALVERPNVLVCQFEEEFLAVPQECLILTMKANQNTSPARCPGQAHAPVPDRQQHRPARCQRRHRGQRARGAPAPGRCQILL